MKEASREDAPTESAPRVLRSDGSRGSFTRMPTAELVLEPKLIKALRRIAPRSRRPKAPWLVGLASLAMGAWLGTRPVVGAFLREHLMPPSAGTGPSASASSQGWAAEVAVPGVARSADAPSPSTAASAASLPIDPASAASSPNASRDAGVASTPKKKGQPKSSQH